MRQAEASTYNAAKRSRHSAPRSAATKGTPEMTTPGRASLYPPLQCHYPVQLVADAPSAFRFGSHVLSEGALEVQRHPGGCPTMLTMEAIGDSFQPNCVPRDRGSLLSGSAKMFPRIFRSLEDNTANSEADSSEAHVPSLPGSEPTCSSSPVHPRPSVSRPRHGDTGCAAYNAPQSRLLRAIRPNWPHNLPGSATGATITLGIPAPSVAPAVSAVPKTNLGHSRAVPSPVDSPVRCSPLTRTNPASSFC
jgi:hypothetical protein